MKKDFPPSAATPQTELDRVRADAELFERRYERLQAWTMALMAECDHETITRAARRITPPEQLEIAND